MEDLERADEAFIASSVREVMPIAVIDEIELPAAPGPVTQAAARALAQRVDRELAGAGQAAV
jgi:branched-chain amino acid aminotransferase